METNEMAMEPCCAQSAGEHRVVEAEFRLPKLNRVELPKVDWSPVRKAAADVLLTGLGVGVLMARGAMAAVKAAYQAGATTADKPGSVAHTMVSVVRGTEKVSQATGAAVYSGAGIKMHVPVLPIESYDALSMADISVKLEGLTAEQLAVLREYELTHANRAEVLEIIQARLA